jgi:ATP-dependent helicase HrpB
MPIRDDLPIAALLPRVLDSLAQTPRLVLEAPPGAGKTTQVPLALLAAPWLQGRRILMLEPRRIAARAAAGYMAAQLGETVGQTVGYRIRFEQRVGPTTRIEVLTEGILTRLLLDDPERADVGAIVFDEFHERHLHGDVGAALALEVQRALRPDLRLLVMSATLDDARLARWLDAPRLASAGRTYPVRIAHLPAPPGTPVTLQIRRAVQQALAQTPGDVLVFLAGRREIAQAQRALQGIEHAQPLELLPLHGELSLAGQHAALVPAAPGTRRVVLATNLAESSLTLPGVTAVVDSGEARVPRFDPNSGFTRLQTVRIAQDSAAQRAGRAGRVAPGLVLRLWPESQRLESARAPEILQVELSGLALDLAAWGSSDLPWLDAPPAGALAQARELLRALGALDATDRISTRGRAMRALGAVPRLAAAALDAEPAQHALLADLLALIDARNPLRGAARSDDLRAQLAALHAWRDGGARAAHTHGADAGALAAIEQASRGWRRRLGVKSAASGVPHTHALGDRLLPAFPDRIARRSDTDPLRYTLSNGRGARLHEASALRGESWLLVTELRAEDGDALILQAAPFDAARLRAEYPQRFSSARELRWNARRGAAEAFEIERFDALLLSRRHVPLSAEQAGAALLAGIRAQALDALPWNSAARSLRQRIAALRGWLPALGLPDVGDSALLDTLEQWLLPFLDDVRGLAQIDGECLHAALRARLDHAQWQALEREAPARLRVPSGRELTLDYGDPATPVLAVKLQELFGLAETPRVARGTVPVTLHLLSPGGRPIQVTRDLRGFWDRTYAEVKKELKGRYPKHPWPDDPWAATPTHRAKPRGG